MNFFCRKIAYQVPKRPYRVTGCGYPTGLSVLLDPMVDDYYGTFFSGFGFRLLIHSAHNFPDENSETKVVTSTRESFVRINPESTYATNDIRRMDLKWRNCLFGSERTLDGLSRYSFINCMFECRMRMVLQACGCLPAYVANNGSIRVCGVLNLNCMIESKRKCRNKSILCIYKYLFYCPRSFFSCVGKFGCAALYCSSYGELSLRLPARL